MTVWYPVFMISGTRDTIRGGVKRLARWMAGAGGVFPLARELTAQHPRVLMYHNFCGETRAPSDRTSARLFRRQLAYLRRHYQPIRLKDLGQRLAEGVLPPRSVALTVDDGHANFIRYALPLLQELHIPVTFFVLSELSNSGDWLCADKWMYAREHAAPQSRPGDFGVTLDDLLRMPAADRELCLEDLARRGGVRIPERPPAAYELVSWRDLNDLARSELVDIGSHSRTHRLLSDADANDSWDEIDGSRRELERRLDVEVATFCFPTGRPSDYRPDQVEMVARAGYSCATAAHFGYVTGESNRFDLPRLGGVFEGMSRFRQELDGFELLRQRVGRERSS